MQCSSAPGGRSARPHTLRRPLTLTALPPPRTAGRHSVRTQGGRDFDVGLYNLGRACYSYACTLQGDLAGGGPGSRAWPCGLRVGTAPRQLRFLLLQGLGPVLALPHFHASWQKHKNFAGAAGGASTTAPTTSGAPSVAEAEGASHARRAKEIEV